MFGKTKKEIADGKVSSSILFACMVRGVLERSDLEFTIFVFFSYFNLDDDSWRTGVLAVNARLLNFDTKPEV